jgi:hypothetical protein
LRKYLKRPSPALAVATIALFAALSGGAIAAVSIPNNSVGHAQLMNNSVGLNNLRSGVNAALARAGTPGPAGPVGPRGATGLTGATGATGATGPAGATGPQGVPGTARAYGLVGSTGVLSRSAGVVSVTHTAGTGLYCIQLIPSIVANNTILVGSPDFPGDSTVTGATANITHVEFDASCGTNGIQAFTFEVANGLNVTAHDQAFSFVVP